MKNNKLIAAFLNTSNTNNYHSDFNALMIAIEKIEGTSVNGYTWTTTEDKTPVEFQFTVEISGAQCMVCRDVSPQYYGTEIDFLKLYDCRNKSKIDAMYLAVVSFIKWYNRQTKLKCFNNPNHLN
ncbi:hypothetical protein [Mucilaginibacter sp.]|jgi:hypothetical protein|uniref:hypothetical protein n=1 Tax=Mucilaginibacter sp. TaxID=1882438 RepID=UPI00356A2343